MARRLIWSAKAQNDRIAIFKYWNQRNQSKRYSKKLNALFKITTDLIKAYPQIGIPTDYSNVKAKLVRDYYLFYKQLPNQDILILTIWDTRQNPDELKFVLA